MSENKTTDKAVNENARSLGDELTRGILMSYIQSHGADHWTANVTADTLRDMVRMAVSELLQIYEAAETSDAELFNVVKHSQARMFGDI